MCRVSTTKLDVELKPAPGFFPHVLEPHWTFAHPLFCTAAAILAKVPHSDTKVCLMNCCDFLVRPLWPLGVLEPDTRISTLNCVCFWGMCVFSQGFLYDGLILEEWFCSCQTCFLSKVKLALDMHMRQRFVIYGWSTKGVGPAWQHMDLETSCKKVCECSLAAAVVLVKGVGWQLLKSKGWCMEWFSFL